MRRQFTTNIAEVRHRDTFEPTLRLLQLVVREIELSSQIPNTISSALPCEEMTEGVYTVNDFGDILLLVAVICLEQEMLG